MTSYSFPWHYFALALPSTGSVWISKPLKPLNLKIFSCIFPRPSIRQNLSSFAVEFLPFASSLALIISKVGKAKKQIHKQESGKQKKDKHNDNERTVKASLQRKRLGNLQLRMMPLPWFKKTVLPFPKIIVYRNRWNGLIHL